MNGDSFRKIIQRHRRLFHGDAYMFFLFDQILSMTQAKAHQKSLFGKIFFVPAFGARFTQKWMAGEFGKSRYALRMKLREMAQHGVIDLKTDDWGTTVTIKGLAEQGGGWPLTGHNKHISNTRSLDHNRSYKGNLPIGQVSNSLYTPGVEETKRHLLDRDAVRIGGIPSCAQQLLDMWK